MKSLYFLLPFLFLITSTYSQSHTHTHALAIATNTAADALLRSASTARTHTHTRTLSRHPPAIHNSDSATPQTRLHLCSTSRDSPTYSHVLVAARLLKELGTTRCEQKAPAFATCTVIMTYESAGIMICGLKGAGMKCSEAGKTAEGLTEVCMELVGGVHKVGGTAYVNPREPRDKTRVVVFNNWDGFE